ncbi:MAG: hypothetical protein PF517_09680 [Salinivirgaceae bacterium]|nr:hypothetical protein [Salinivirgaceae bacterium]
MPQKLIKGSFIIFLTILINANSSQVVAQKCNYEKNEIEALTEMVLKRTSPQLLCRISGQPLYAKAQCIGTNKYLKLQFYKFNDFSFQEDREVGFILSSNEELVVYPRVMPLDSSKMDQFENVNSLMIYKLTEEQYKALTIYPIKKFKYFVSTGFVEQAVASKRQSVVMNVLKCIE